MPRRPRGRAACWAPEDFWHKVGIDPVRCMTRRGTLYTLRCYLDDAPVFPSAATAGSACSVAERSLARYLADEHDHDLSDLATYDDIRNAATDGSLRVDVTEDNVYVTSGLADDFADGPDAVDREQLELAVELLGTSASTPRMTSSTRRWTPTCRWVAWSPTCWTRDGPQAQPALRRCRRAVGSRWRPSSSPGCSR